MSSKKLYLPLLLVTGLIIMALIFKALPGHAANTLSTTFTFKPTADAYVIATSPTTNFGAAPNLRVDNSPITRSYLRFVVSGLNGATVTSAKLRLYANSANSVGYTVSALSNNTWTESTITYSNAPAPGSIIKTSAAVVAGQWIEADLSSYVKTQGTYNLVLSTTSPTNTSLAAREVAANAPQLVIVANATAPIQPTATAVTGAPTATRLPVGPTATKPAPTATLPPAVGPTATPVAGLTKVNLTKGPDLIYTGTNTSMKLFWQWTANTTFRVDWGATASYGKSSAAISASDATNHIYTYTITGLTPGAHYYYRVVVGSQYSAATFTAGPPATATTLKFVSYGDDRSNPGTHNAVAGQVVKLSQTDPAYQTISLSEGDLVASGDTDSTWTSEMFSPSLTNIRAELANLSVLPVMGNHEGTGGLFKRYFPLPFVASRYWSFDYGPAHIIMLDQYTSYTVGSAQYNWFKSDLAATTKKWKIVMFHEPGWSANGGHPNNTTVQTVLQPLMVQYNVALALTGHNHYYARAMVNNIPELTIGTGGAPLYTPASGQPNIVKTYKGNGYAKFEINGSTLTGWFINSSDAVIDTFTVTR